MLVLELGAVSGSKESVIHACTELACARGRGQERGKMAAQSRGPASRHASDCFWQPRTAFCLLFSRPWHKVSGCTKKRGASRRQ